MEKEAASYGFKGYENREDAVPLIDEANQGDLDATLKLLEIERRDRDYGFGTTNRRALNKLDRRGFTAVLKNSPGFVEEQPGFVRRKKDIYVTEEGARDAYNFLQEKILPNYGDAQSENNKALLQEINANNKLKDATDRYLRRQELLINRSQGQKLEYQVEKNIGGPVGHIRAFTSSTRAKINQAKADAEKKQYHKLVDKHRRQVGKVSDGIVYQRFADALHNSLGDDLELYNFRYY